MTSGMIWYPSLRIEAFIRVLRFERASKPRINRFAFQGQNSEYAFVNSPKWFASDESFKGFNAQGELSQSE